MNADFSLLIKTLLTAPLQTAPNQQIISDGLGLFTYRDFVCRLHRLAGALSREGFGQGDVVGVMDWDTHRYLECFFAVPMMGAVLHTLNVRLSPKDLEYIINHAEDQIIIVDADVLPLLEVLNGKIPCVRKVVVATEDGFEGWSTELPDPVDYEAFIEGQPTHFDCTAACDSAAKEPGR